MPSHFDSEKWSKLSIFEQMGNIGSEVGRTMTAMKRGDIESANGAYLRGLDLIDETVAMDYSEYRRREILRARELFTEAIESNTPDPSLENYFFQFALAARATR